MASTATDRPLEILLVEDNPVDVLLVQKCFKELEVAHHLSVMSDGQKALIFLHRADQYTEAPRPDLILLDLKLPKVSGLDVLAAVKSSPDLKHIPVIVLTMSDDAKDIFEAYHLQASCYLTKPSNAAGFREMAKMIEALWLKGAKLPRPSAGELAD